LAQLGDDEADVVTGTAQDGVEGVTERALERVSGQVSTKVNRAQLETVFLTGEGWSRVHHLPSPVSELNPALGGGAK
jgi:hypothetical protein